MILHVARFSLENRQKIRANNFVIRKFILQLLYSSFFWFKETE